MFGVGGQERLVILFIILILLGADKVPKLAKGRTAQKIRGMVRAILKKNDIDGAFRGTAQAAFVLPWRGGSLCGPLRHLLEGFIRLDSPMAHALL